MAVPSSKTRLYASLPWRSRPPIKPSQACYRAAQCSCCIAAYRAMCAEPALKKIGFMSKNNDQAWKTKYGPRRVRQEAPTLKEPITAAQGLSEEPDVQAEIAAALLGLPYEEA